MAQSIEIDGKPADGERLSERIGAEDVQFVDLLARDGRIHGLSDRLLGLVGEFRRRQSISADASLIRSALTRFLRAGQESGAIRVELYRCLDGSVRILIRQRNASRPSEAISLRCPADPERDGRDPGPSAAHQAEGVVVVSADGLVRTSSLGPIGFIAGSRIVWPESATIVRAVLPLSRALHGQQITDVTLPIHEHELGLFDAAFVLRADGLVAVTRIGESAFDAAHARIADVRGAWNAVEWERP